MKLKPRSVIVAAVLSLLAAYLGNRLAQAVATAPQEDILPSVDAIGETLANLLATSPLLPLHGQRRAAGRGLRLRRRVAGIPLQGGWEFLPPPRRGARL